MMQGIADEPLGFQSPFVEFSHINPVEKTLLALAVCEINLFVCLFLRVHGSTMPGPAVRS